MFKFPNGSCSTTLSGMFCYKLFIFFLVNESLFFFVSACSKLLWIHFIFLCIILSGNSSFIESYYLGASVFVTVVWKWLKSDFFSCNSYSAICPCKKTEVSFKNISFERFWILHSNFRNSIFKRTLKHLHLIEFLDLIDRKIKQKNSNRLIHLNISLD